jgi:hypothetical protein
LTSEGKILTTETYEVVAHVEVPQEGLGMGELGGGRVGVFGGGVVWVVCKKGVQKRFWFGGDVREVTG